MKPANDASASLRIGLLLASDVELFAHEFRFIAGTAAEKVGEMLDAMLAGVGSFGRSD